MHNLEVFCCICAIFGLYLQPKNTARPNSFAELYNSIIDLLFCINTMYNGVLGCTIETNNYYDINCTYSIYFSRNPSIPHQKA